MESDMQVILELISFGITIFANTVLGLMVLFRNPRNKLNQKFALLVLSVVLWIATTFFYYVVSINPWLLWIGRINLSSAALVPLTTYIFVISFPAKMIKISRWVSGIVIFVSILFFALALTPLMDIKEMARGLSRTTAYGPLYSLYLLELIAVCVLCIGILLRKWRKATGILRAQLAYLLLGFASLSAIAITFNGILPYFFNNYAFQEFGSLASIAFVGFTSYAMVRHRFMDINRVLASLLTNISVFVLLGLLYSFAAYIIGYIFFPALLQVQYIFVTVAVSLLIRFLIIGPLSGNFERIGRYVFARSLYNREQLLQEAHAVISSTVDIRKLITEMINLIKTKMGISFITFVRLHPDRMRSISTLPQKQAKKMTAFSEEEIQMLLTMEEPVITEELPQGTMKKMLMKRKIDLFFPLQSTKMNTRFMLFGRKKSGNLYYEYDVTTLQMLSQPFLIAIQNASQVYNVHHFNRALKEEVVKATKEIKRINEQLRKADKLKDEFISIASHELKTPTTAIQGFLWLVLQKDKNLSPYSREKIERVAKLTGHMTTLVNDMLDVSKIESNRISLHPELFDIRNLVEEIKGEMDLVALQKAIQIHLANGNELMVWADRQRMHQVVSNLINNAVKYSPKGAKVKISFVRKDAMVAVSVADTGIGIREEDMPKLFTKFGKLSDANGANSQLPGTGLGLYITKNLVNLSGGTINVNSKYGKGTTFTFTLPTKQK